MVGELSKDSWTAHFEPAHSLVFDRLDRKELCYSAVTAPKEADRLVVAHEAGPKPSTFQ